MLLCVHRRLGTHDSHLDFHTAPVSSDSVGGQMGVDLECPVSGVTMQLRRSLKEGCRKAKAWSVHTVHAPSVAFRHLLPNSGYALKGYSLSTCCCPPTLSAPSESYYKAVEAMDLYIMYTSQRWSVRVPGEIKRSRDLRGGRWSWTLTFAQKRY